MKKKTRNTTNPNYLKLILPVIGVTICIAIIAGVFILLRNVLSVRHIKCRILPEQACSSELVEALTPLYNQPLFFKDYQALLEKAQTIKQPVTVYAIEKKLPNSISVTFQPESAAYAINFADTTAIVSNSGKTFQDYQGTTSLIVVETAQPLSTDNGFIFPDVHHTVLNIIDTSQELQLPLIKLSWVDKSTIKLSMENREELYIIDSESPRLQLHKLSTILTSSEYRDIAEPKRELDLRFNMPVLRTLP